MLTYVFIFITMIFLHIYDDFRAQGILAQFKQKKWWEENCPGEMYKYDWVISLIAHSFRWTFMILLPPTVYAYVIGIDFNSYLEIYMIVFILNCVFHALVDHIKANMYLINLVQDQMRYIFQIILTCGILFSAIELLQK